MRESRRFKVLLVDDSAYNIFVMQELLQVIPTISDVVTALNGREALVQVTSNKSQPFDVIFLDIHMPIMDGNQTVRALRDMHARQEVNLSNTKIIALSAITGQQFRENPNSINFDSFMEKPVSFETL